MNDITVIAIRTPADLAEALRIRTRVFVEEQGVPLDEEIDAYDDANVPRDDVLHVLGRLDGTPVATARVVLDAYAGEYAHIGRVAVLAEHRGKHIGEAVMRALHDEARRRGFGGITISAQQHAVTFYERLGYVAHGPSYLEAGIDHRAMDLRFER